MFIRVTIHILIHKSYRLAIIFAIFVKVTPVIHT